jgi:hypothetical protein
MSERFLRASVYWMAALLVASFAATSIVRAQVCLGTDACNPANVNAILFVDGVRQKSLAAAIDACPQTCWIIDNFPERFSVNPFANIAAKSVKVTLGRGTWVTKTTIVIPTKSQLEGSGRGDPGFSGTVIQADSSFPANAPVIEMGNATTSMGVRVENLTIDCNNVPGCIGLQNLRSQEQSGARHLLIANITGIGLDVEGSAAQNSGPYEDLEFYGGTDFSVTTASLCARILNVPAFRGIHGATCNFNNYGVHPYIGIQMDSSGTLNDIHIEGTDIGIGVGVSSAGTGAMLQNIYGGGWNIQTLVRIFSGREILLTGLVRSTTPVLLVHNGHTVRSPDLAFYVVHNAGQTPAPATIANLAASSAGASVATQPVQSNRYTAYALALAESPDMMNVVSGTAVLDEKGQAEVKLPEAFEATGHEFRYQLTPIGDSAAVYIGREIQGNAFRIAGGKPGQRVSWQVTSIQREPNSDAPSGAVEAGSQRNEH